MDNRAMAQAIGITTAREFRGIAVGRTLLLWAGTAAILAGRYWRNSCFAQATIRATQHNGDQKISQNLSQEATLQTKQKPRTPRFDLTPSPGKRQFCFAECTGKRLAVHGALSEVGARADPTLRFSRYSSDVSLKPFQRCHRYPMTAEVSTFSARKQEACEHSRRGPFA